MQNPNLEYVHQLADGDQEFVTNIIEVLKKEFPIEVETFYANYNKHNFKETANNIHKIKYKFSLLGLNDDFKLATDFENDVKNRKTELFNKFDEVLKKIEQFLKTI